MMKITRCERLNFKHMWVISQDVMPLVFDYLLKDLETCVNCGLKRTKEDNGEYRYNDGLNRLDK